MSGVNVKRTPISLSRVWITTGGKDHWQLVTRWTLIKAAFSRKDVEL